MNTKEEYSSKRKVNRKIKMRISSILFAVIFIFWGIYYILQSDLMNLKEIELTGNEKIENEEIISASNLVINRNIFKYNLEEIGENILNHPYVKTTDVKRKFPNTIRINVKEREEYAIISYMGSYIFIDEEKIVLRASDSYIANDNVLITGVELDNFKLGEPIETVSEEELDTVTELLKAARMTSIFNMISEITISNKNDIRLITLDGAEVLLGEGRNPAYLMVALDEILVNLYTRNIKDVVIDMRYEGHISVKDRNS